MLLARSALDLEEVGAAADFGDLPDHAPKRLERGPRITLSYLALQPCQLSVIFVTAQLGFVIRYFDYNV